MTAKEVGQISLTLLSTLFMMIGLFSAIALGPVLRGQNRWTNKWYLVRIVWGIIASLMLIFCCIYCAWEFRTKFSIGVSLFLAVCAIAILLDMASRLAAKRS